VALHLQSPIRLHGVIVKYRDNFTFTLLQKRPTHNALVTFTLQFVGETDEKELYICNKIN